MLDRGLHRNHGLSEFSLLEDLIAEAARRGWKFEMGTLCALISCDYIEAPAKVTANVDALFLAGGISGCPDSQSKAVSMLRHTPYTVLNPRRKAFPAEIARLWLSR